MTAAFILLALSLLLQMTVFPAAAYAAEAGSTSEVALSEGDEQAESGATRQSTEIAAEEEPQEPPIEGEEPGEQPVDGGYILPVFETSDTHGHLADISAAPYKYLLAFISDKVKDVRGYGAGARDDLAILLDGGDIYQGHTLSNLLRGQPIAAAYQIMGYDAVTVGNHDFDWGLETAVDADKTMMDYSIGDLAGENLVPVVCANIYRNGAKIPLADDYIILRKTAVDGEGNEIPVNVAVIGFAGNYGTSIKYEQFAGAGYSISPDYDKINSIAASLEESGQRASTAGNWLTSIYRRIAGADVAFINGGGLRTEFLIPEGQDRRIITLSDIYTMLPFGNPIYCYEITYEEFLRALQYALSDQGLILLSRMSGLDCYYTGTTVNAIVVGGEADGGSGAAGSTGTAVEGASASGGSASSDGAAGSTGTAVDGASGSGGESFDSGASGGETIYANGKWKEGWKDQKLRVAINEYMATTNRVSTDGQANPFFEWKETDKLVRADQIENEEAVKVLTAEASANEGHLFIDTAPHFIEKEHEDIPEAEGPDEPEPEPEKPDPEELEKHDPEKPGTDESGKDDSGKPASEKPGKPSGAEKEKSEKTESTNGSDATSPKAGDNAEIGLWLVLMAIALPGLVRVCRSRRQ